MAIQNPVLREKINAICGSVILFSILCISTGPLINMGLGDATAVTLPPEGGMVGPVGLTAERNVVEITVEQPMARINNSNFIEVSVLDGEGEHLFGFGEELWDEEGRDSDGYWHEWETELQHKVTLNSGSYRFQFQSESPEQARSMTVTIQPQFGSSLIFYVVGFPSLFGACLLYAIANGESSGKKPGLSPGRPRGSPSQSGGARS